MKKLNTKSKFIALAGMAVIGMAAIWTFNNRASAKPMPNCGGGCTALFNFGMLGITSEQTARLSVVNIKACTQSRPCTPAQVALAWALDSSPNLLVIPGTSSRRHLRENLSAAEVRLDAEAVHQLSLMWEY